MRNLKKLGIGMVAIVLFGIGGYFAYSRFFTAPYSEVPAGHYVLATIDGQRTKFSGDVLKPASGRLLVAQGQRGNSSSLWIEARTVDYLLSGEYVQIILRPGDLELGAHTGIFALRSKKIWFQSDCQYTILSSDGLMGDLEGIATCEQMKDHKDRDSEITKTLTDVKFRVRMRGRSHGIE